MKITILNGSPRGRYSSTLQSVNYLQKHYPEVEFEVFQIGQRIKAFEKNDAMFMKCIQSIRESTAVIWVYPVYTFLVPFQLMRFIELVFEKGQEDVFKNKYAAQISTSKHFFDNLAANYVHQISEDLDMHCLPAFCADMDDLTLESGRSQLLSFAEELIETIQEELPVSRVYQPVCAKSRTYSPELHESEEPKRSGHRIVLVTDCTDPDSNLGRMITKYQQSLNYELEIVNLNDFKFSGGCLGCFRCAFDGKCTYKDGFDEFHTTKIRSAECVIFAADIKRHWFNSIWKCYDDRQFYNGHRTTMKDTSFGYLLSGPLRQEANLRQVLEGRIGVSHTYLVDIVTDEYESDAEIDALIEKMARRTAWAVESKPQRPVNFLGVGGMKIFRDLIYVMRGLMQEDHRFYKREGIYRDFPQRNVKRILQMQLVGFLMKLPGAQKRAAKSMKEIILKQYTDIIEKY